MELEPTLQQQNISASRQYSSAEQSSTLNLDPIQHSLVRIGAPYVDQPRIDHPRSSIVVEPPSLAQWRQKLFDLHEIITLDEEQFAFSTLYTHISTDLFRR